MRISMPRGDLKYVRFLVNDPNGTATDVDFEEIYFTVKKTRNDRDMLIHKRLSRNEIFKLNNGDYQIVIRPEDTNKLRYGEYIFDIQLCYKSQVKQTAVGQFVLTDEVTFAENER